MPKAARKTDATAHGNTLSPGPGSGNVNIGGFPAWRALPSSVGPAVAAASGAVKELLDMPILTPADAGAKVAKISQTLGEAAGKAAGAGAAGAPAAASSAVATMNTTNVTLTATWTSASAAPGGQPAANEAYTKGIQAAGAAAASAAFSAMGGLADVHACPVASAAGPHGPGFVFAGSPTVFVNYLPLSRMGDKVAEAAGGMDAISKGEPSVNVDG